MRDGSLEAFLTTENLKCFSGVCAPIEQLSRTVIGKSEDGPHQHPDHKQRVTNTATFLLRAFSLVSAQQVLCLLVKLAHRSKTQMSLLAPLSDI